MYRREPRRLLDAIRWISAFIVAFGHTWVAVIHGQDGWLAQLLGALANTRHSWLVIFFVLSGYLVGGQIMLGGARFDLRRYAIDRFSRIYIVLIPALMLTVALDGAVFLTAPHNPIYAGPWHAVGDSPPFANYSLRDILASLLCLENVIGGPMGSDGPLWSLGFEWSFYLALPALMLPAGALARAWRLPAWLVQAATLAGSAMLLAAAHMPYAGLLWSIWLCGGVAHLATTRSWSNAALRWIGGVVCLFGFVAAFRLDYHFSDALVGFGFALFLSVFPHSERGIHPGLDQALSGASYSLYVTHMPVLAAVCAACYGLGLLPQGGVPFGPSSMTVLAGVAAAVTATTWAIHVVFEVRTGALRRWLIAISTPRLSQPAVIASAD